MNFGADWAIATTIAAAVVRPTRHAAVGRLCADVGRLCAGEHS
jgi:hypothetical protein